nr:nuclear transport factor 2 family protein [Streptomyces sp. HNM0574]
MEDWFARYDAHAERGDVEAMAAMALFPLNLVTDEDGAPGSGCAAQWDRERYLSTMSRVMGASGDEEVRFTSERTPHFLGRSLAVVHTDSAMTAGGRTTRMRYADVLVKQDGSWYFQTMVQSGWAAALRGEEG